MALADCCTVLFHTFQLDCFSGCITQAGRLFRGFNLLFKAILYSVTRARELVKNCLQCLGWYSGSVYLAVSPLSVLANQHK